MPFQSEKQRRFLHANHPEIAKRWEREYATGGISNLESVSVEVLRSFTLIRFRSFSYSDVFILS